MGCLRSHTGIDDMEGSASAERSHTEVMNTFGCLISFAASPAKEAPAVAVWDLGSRGDGETMAAQRSRGHRETTAAAFNRGDREPTAAPLTRGDPEDGGGDGRGSRGRRRRQEGSRGTAFLLRGGSLGVRAWGGVGR